MNEKKMKILAAIPCFNEEATIGSVVIKAKRHVDEVLVIDDGSVDDTARIAQEAGAKVIKHGGNKGYGAAIQSCFRYAKENNFDAMVILDGDGQHNADEIPHVLEPILDGTADISVGSRFLEEKHKEKVPLYRRFGIAVITWFTNLGSGKSRRVVDAQSGFRAYSRRAIEKIDPKDEGMGVSAEILLQARKRKLKIKEVPVSCRYDVEGSTEGPVRHGLSVLLSILHYMEVEHSLLFFGVPGLIIFSLGLFLGWRVYQIYTTSGVFPTGSALVTIILLIIGMLLGITGLILHAVIIAARRKWR